MLTFITMNFINYKRKKYPFREIKLPEFGYVNISTESLNKVLLNKEGTDYRTKEAKFVDEKIFYFIEDKKINLSDKVLKKYFADQNI